MVSAEHVMLFGGIAAFVVTLHWVRQRELRAKYALSWLAIAFVLLLIGLFPNIVMEPAHRLSLSYAALAAFVTAGILFCFAFSVSISLSRQYRRNIRLTQGIALLEKRIRDLESQNSADACDANLKQTELADIPIQSIASPSSKPTPNTRLLN